MLRSRFFGEEGYKNELRIFNDYKTQFEFLLEINALALKILNDLKIDDNNIQQKVAYCLFRRLIEGAQSAIVLESRGLDLDVSVVMRVMFETLVYLKKACTDMNFVKAYIKRGEEERLSMLDIIINNKKFFPELSVPGAKEKIEKEKQKIKTEIRNVSCPSLPKMESLAKAVNLTGYYKTFYCLASQNIHVNVRSLRKYVNEGINMNWDIQLPSPNYQNIETALLSISHFLVDAINSICDFFSLKKDSLEDIKEKFDKLFSKQEA